MQGKDWITLFFPILCNGILLFVFTQLIEAKKRRKQQAQAVHQKLISEYIKIIENILHTFCTENQNSILQSLNATLPLFFSFSKKNKERLKEYTQKANIIEETWNKLVEVIHFVQDNEDGIISGKSGEKVSFLVSELFNDLVEVSQLCISDIYERGDYAA